MVSTEKLKNLIADILYHVSAKHIHKHIEDLGLQKSDLNPNDGKKVYVKDALRNKTLQELLITGEKV